jgi:photosystem II stability/assembly factor-like uncharacterized protein
MFHAAPAAQAGNHHRYFSVRAAASMLVLMAATAATGAGCGGGSHALEATVDAGDDSTPDAGPLWSLNKAGVVDGDLEAIWGSGANLFVAGKSGSIGRSDDSGQTWNAAATGLSGAPELRHIAGTDSSDVWAAGSESPGTGVLLHSDDRGQSWQRRTIGNGGNGDFTGVWAFDANQVIVAGSAGTIYRTADGGITWKQVYIRAGVRLYGLWGAPQGATFEAYAVGGQAAATDGGASSDAGDAALVGLVLHSTDGGKTWAEVAMSAPAVLWNVWGTPDGASVYAAGEGASLVFTLDHGTTWYVEGRAEGASSLDLVDVWVAPGDAAAFFASSIGIVRSIRYLPNNGPIQFASETLPAPAGGPAPAAAIWGSDGSNIWACGPAGTVWHRN